MNFQMPRSALPRQKTGGFTLIELMITVAIIAILAAIALPSYRDSIRKSNRVAAKTALLDTAAREEKYYSLANSYTTDLIGTGSTGLGIPSTALKNGSQILYNLTIVVDTTKNPTFTATATPAGDQANDSCGTFTINNYGQQTPTTAGCW